MTVENNLKEMSKSLDHLEKSGNYDAEKLSYSLKAQLQQLEFFYCHLVRDGNCDETHYRLDRRPQVHQLAYFNIGRGYPKELMDGHWCYIVKDLGYKMLIIPCTSIKNDAPRHRYVYDITIEMDHTYQQSRIQLSDMRMADVQRLDLRKPFYNVITPKEDIMKFIYSRLFT